MDQNTEKRIENPYIPMAFEVPTKEKKHCSESIVVIFCWPVVAWVASTLENRYFFVKKIGAEDVQKSHILGGEFQFLVSFFVGNLLFYGREGLQSMV